MLLVRAFQQNKQGLPSLLLETYSARSSFDGAREEPTTFQPLCDIGTA
jgi:hypothetical protein